MFTAHHAPGTGNVGKPSKGKPDPYRGPVSLIQCDAADLPELFPTTGNPVPPMTAKRNESHAIHNVSSERMANSAAWYGGARSLGEIADLFDKGWAEGAAKLDALAEGLTLPEVEVASVRRRMAYGDQGDELNPWRAMSGDWDVAWQTTTRVTTTAPRTITLGVSWGGNANRKDSELYWSGAQAAVVTDLLERAGYTVELVALSATHSRDHQAADGRGWNWDAERSPLTLSVVTVKRADEPVRLDRIAATICHAGTFRTAGFCAILAGDMDVGFGLGTHVEAGEALKRCGGTDLALPTVDYLLPDAFTLDMARKNIAALVAKLESGALNAA